MVETHVGDVPPALDVERGAEMADDFMERRIFTHHFSPCPCP